jgi:hypothetical protein
VEISGLLHAGANRLEVHVFNTALNELAGQPQRDYTSLRAKYGTRFEPQDMDKVKPIASGLRGAIHLETEPAR